MRRALILWGCLLAACETTGLGPTPRGDLAEGSALASRLSGGDKSALSEAFVEAVEAGEEGKAVAWKGPSAAGSVTPGAWLVGNLWPDPHKYMPLAARVDLRSDLETEQGLHAVRKTANIRGGPSTEAPIVGQFSPGAAVEGVGKVSGQPWMLVAEGGSIRGYVHESLLMKAPGSEMELAGGPTRTPHRCREFRQSVEIRGASDRWTGVACDRGGWRIEAAPSDAPATLY